MATAAGDPIRATDDDVITQASSGKPLVRLIQQVAQSIPSGISTAITFGAGSEDIDTNGWHDTVTNNTRVTPTVAGYYRVTGGYVTTTSSFAAANSIDCAVAKNGVSAASGERQGGATTNTQLMCIAGAILSANGTTDYFECMANQVTGVAINTHIAQRLSSFLEVEFLRPL